MKFENTMKTYNPKAIPQIEMNQKVKISKGKKNVDNRKTQPENIFKGKVMSINSRHFTVINALGIKESFKYSDFICGDISLL